MKSDPRFVLETERLTLRRMDHSDLEDLAQLLSNPQVMRYWPAPFDREQSQQWIQRQQSRYARDGCGYWLAHARETGHCVGQAGLCVLEIDGQPEHAIGYILRTDCWGRGYATEAATAIIDWARNELNISRIVCPVRPENEPSVAVAKRLGLTEEKQTMFASFNHAIYVTPSQETS